MKNFRRATIIVIVAALLHCVPLLQAQSVKHPKFGFRVAPNVGWLKPDARLYEPDGAVFGFSWGFVSEFPITDNYTFSTGFNIVLNNGKLKYPHKIDTTGTLHRKYNLKYLELPLAMRLRTPDRGGPVFYAQLGLSASLLLDAKAEDLFIPVAGIQKKMEKDKISSDVNLLKSSLLVGVGIEYPVGASSKLLFGLMFNNGFTNVLKGNNSAYPATEHAAFPNFIEINLTFLF